MSTFDKDFNYGGSTELTYNVRLGKFMHRMSFEVHVRFKDKGENLQFQTLFNGKVVSKAIIEFPHH